MNRLFVVVVLIAGCVAEDAGGGGGGGGCSESGDSCSGETICVAGSCVAAFGRVYLVSDVSVHVPTTDSSGAAWDIGGGAPDLKIKISVNGSVVSTSVAVADQFNASFAGPFSVTLVAGGSLRIDAVDEDVTVDDPAVACQANPVTAAQLRTRTMSCSASGSTLSWQIDPR